MAIDIHAEHLITAHEASRTLPTRPHHGTIYRWFARGSRGVRLESVMLGGTRYTSREALQRFAERVTAAAASNRPLPEGSTAQQRQAEIGRAEQETEEAGI